MQETQDQLYNKLRLKCWDFVYDSFGYAYIFNKRAELLSRYSNWLTVLGILTPSLIGSIVLGYGIDSELLDFLIPTAVVVGIIQFGASVIAVVYKWSDELSYNYEASQAHSSLNHRFHKLAEFPSENYLTFKSSFELIESEYITRLQQDAKHNITEKEQRKGMKASLRQYQKTCVACKTIPMSMDSTACAVCGNF